MNAYQIGFAASLYFILFGLTWYLKKHTSVIGLTIVLEILLLLVTFCVGIVGVSYIFNFLGNMH